MAEYGIEAFHLTAHRDEMEVYDTTLEGRPKKSKTLKRLLNTMCKKEGIWLLRIHPYSDDEISVEAWTELLAAHRWKARKLRLFPDWQSGCSINFVVYPTSDSNPHLQVETAPQVISL